MIKGMFVCRFVMNIVKIMIQVVVDLVNDLIQEWKGTKVDLFKLFSVNLFVGNKKSRIWEKLIDKVRQTLNTPMTSSR